jgi:glycosyltransferase involved in cell wall biosynthesis
MRILAITQMYPRPGNEGFATFNAHQFRELAKIHEVRVLCPVPWTKRFGGDAGDWLRPHRYLNRDGIWVEHPTYFFTPKLFEHYYGHFYLWSVRRAVRRTAREFCPDIILSSWAHPDGWAAVQMGREFGLPVVIKVIGSDVLVVTKNVSRRNKVAEALRGADAGVAVSQDLADHVMQLGASPDRVLVVPEGVDKELFSPGDQAVARARLKLPSEGKRVLFVGNLLFSKGVGVLLEACDLLRRRGLNFCCDLVGKGRDEASLRAMANRLRLSEIVRFAGVFPQAQLCDWYRSSDLLVLPSFSEGIPNVLREAMMCGRGFVATKVGGIPEITDESVGRLVEVGNPYELAEAIKCVLSQPFVVSREFALKVNLSWAQSAMLLSELLTLVKQRHRPPPAPAL